MNLWISLRRKAAFWIPLLAAVLLLNLACGGHQDMQSGKTDDEMLAQTKVDGDSTVKLSGEDDSATGLDPKNAAADARREARVAAIPGGSTRSGVGKLDRVTVRAGDTLWKLAARKDVYGSGYLYPLIYQANKARIPDPNNLPAGLSLTVPRDVPDPQVEIAKEQAMTGELLEKKPTPVAAPTAPATPSQAQAAPPAPPAKGSRAWWLLGLLAVAGGAYFYWRSRQGDEA